MIVARWSITAKFGRSKDAVALLKEWNETFGKQVGLQTREERVLIGSIGARESEIQSEIELESLSKLDAAFAKLATLDGHADWGKKLESVIVSGSNHWQIFRRV